MAWRAESAEFKVGSKADSGFLIDEKMLGIRLSSEVITDLDLVSFPFRNDGWVRLHTSIHTGQQTGHRSKARMALPNLS